jgi:hypothetical protein
MTGEQFLNLSRFARAAWVHGATNTATADLERALRERGDSLDAYHCAVRDAQRLLMIELEDAAQHARDEVEHAHFARKGGVQ